MHFRIGLLSFDVEQGKGLCHSVEVLLGHDPGVDLDFRALFSRC